MATEFNKDLESEMSLEDEFELRSLFVRADALEGAICELQCEEHDEEMRIRWREYVLPLLRAEHEKAREDFRASAQAFRLGLEH